MQMLHPDGHAPARPIDVPDPHRRARPEGRPGGPRARRRALRHAAAAGVRQRLLVGALPGVGHRPRRGRGRRTPTTRGSRAGPGWALAYHGAYEFGGPDAVRALPGGAEWMDVVERTPRTRAPPRRARRALRRAQRGRPGGVGRGWPRDAPGRDVSGTPGQVRDAARRARRARRHRDRVPALRPGRGGRARTVPGRRDRAEHRMSREITTVVDGLTFAECPRWHEGRIWFVDFYTHRVLSAREDGSDLRTEAEVPAQPSGLGWLPDGRLLVVSMRDRAAAAPRARRHAGDARRPRRARRRPPERHGRRRAGPRVRRQLRLRPDGRRRRSRPPRCCRVDPDGTRHRGGPATCGSPTAA